MNKSERQNESDPVVRGATLGDSTADLTPGASPPSAGEAERDAERLVQILDDYLARLERGDAPSRAELLAEHPELARQLEACLGGLEFIHGAAGPAGGRGADPSVPRQLGDFRILREVGRGGMGAVYEAIQVSLHRRVALKVLRFAGVSDPDAIGRFQREAETVARLHHTHIVPIFAVGCEQGVNYYAMQFIEGRSLAQLLASGSEEITPQRVAEWGLQAAEALRHAHERGVIHRDVKPSNLILDQDQRLWLTDFGLALCTDDVTLSMTGALLGTPRYMSPEQASAVGRQLDQRTDLFSLGATLYELLTGRPAFEGDTPHAVIHQILSAEPVAPRSIRPSIPRDLETVVLKCLSKEPQGRYATARELADDLRAFLDERPLKARRAGPVQRAIKWFRRQRRSVALAVLAVAATLLVVVSSVAGWWWYDQTRRGSLVLTTPVPPLVAEFYREASDRLVRVDTLPNQTPIELPSGEYQLRVAGEGLLSQTYEIEVDAGEQRKFSLNPREQLVAPAIPVERFAATVRTDHGAWVVGFTSRGLRLWKNSPPILSWTVDYCDERGMPLADIQALAGRTTWQWLPSGGVGWRTGFESYEMRPWLAEQTRDLNGDQVPDLVLAARHQAWLLAISGADGRPLWLSVASRDELKSASESQDRPKSSFVSAHLAAPEWTDDRDGDGIPDLVVQTIDCTEASGAARPANSATRTMALVSGASGAMLWRYELPVARQTDDSQVTPYELRWFKGDATGMSSGGASTSSIGRHYVRETVGSTERHGEHTWRPSPPRVVRFRGELAVATVGEGLAHFVELAGGTAPIEPLALPGSPLAPPAWGDLDGDGNDDLVYLDRPVDPAAAVAAPGPTNSATSPLRIVAWSPSRDSELWSRTIVANRGLPSLWTIPLGRWPLVADFDGDGKCEVVAPDGSSSETSPWVGHGTPWGAVAVFEGANGELRWKRRFVSTDRQVDHFVAGPDLDGDGVRELFVATLCGRGIEIHADAVSGKDGRTLWSGYRSVSRLEVSQPDAYLEPLQWWSAGRDGWPLLVVSAAVEGRDRMTHAAFFSAGTGRLEQTFDGVVEWSTRDVDGDGVDELCAWLPKTSWNRDQGGELRIVRGTTREGWKRIGTPVEPALDLDQDQVGDLVELTPEQRLVARSSLTGRALWRTDPFPRANRMRVQTWARGRYGAATRGAASAVDFNGDAVSDLVVFASESSTQFINYGLGNPQLAQSQPIFLVSGRTGETIWNSTDIQVGLLQGVPVVATADVDGDGRSELAFVFNSDLDLGPQASPFTVGTQLRLIVADGRNGRRRWTLPLSPTSGNNSDADHDARHFDLPFVVADLDGDGGDDFLVPSLGAIGSYSRRPITWLAVRGKDGTILWRHELPFFDRSRFIHQLLVPLAVDLDGDGQREVVFVDPRPVPDRPATLLLTVAVRSGREGELVWKREVDEPWPESREGMPVDPRRRRVHSARRGLTSRVVVIPIWEDNYREPKPRLVALDREGIVAVIPVQSSSAVVEDIDRDGVDELLYIREGQLVAAPLAADGTPKWSLAIPSSSEPAVLDRLPSDGSSTSVVVVELRAGADTLMGVDLQTGKARWRAAGLARTVSGTEGGDTEASSAELLAASADSAPYLLAQRGALSLVRRAARAPGGSTGPAESDVGDRIMPTLAMAGRDERWGRELFPAEMHPTARQVLDTCRRGVWLSFSMVLAPLGYLWLLVRNRRFHLKWFLLLPVAVLLPVLGATTMESDPEWTLRARVLMAIAFAPILVLVGVWTWWIASGQWRRLAIWWGLWMGAGTLMLIVQWRVSVARQPLLDEEWLDLRGAWIPFVMTIVFIAWAAVIVLPPEQALRRWLKRR